MLRLGFPVRVLGRRGLRSHDSRRRPQAPHLSVSLVFLRDVISYLRAQNICCYRLADGLAPYLADGKHVEFQRQVDECAVELAEVGGLARAAGLRLTMHLGAHVALS